MHSSSSSLRRSLLSLAFAALPFSTASLAHSQPVQPRTAKTGASVTAVAAGDTQLSGRDDILYVQAPAADKSMKVGLLLNSAADGFADLPQNQHTFQGVVKVAATIADMNGDGIPDFVFATSPASSAGPQLCVYYGTKTASTSGAYSASTSGCTSFALPGSTLPQFSSVSAVPNKGGLPWLFLADTANSAVYEIQNDGRVGNGTSLLGFSLKQAYSLASAASAGNASSSSALLVAAGSFDRSRSSSPGFIAQQGSSIIPYFDAAGVGQLAAMPALADTPAPSQWTATSLVLADIDGDGRADAVALYKSATAAAASADTVATPPAPHPNRMYIWFGNGDGSFSAPEVTALSRPYSFASVADMNGDGKADIVLADDSFVGVLYQQDSRTFLSDFGTVCRPCGEQQVSAAAGITSITTANVDGNGKPDVIVSSATGSPAKASVSTGAAPRATAAPRSGGVTVLPNALITGSVTGGVSASPEPSAVGAGFTITATVGPPATSGSTIPPTGTIQFTIAGTPIGGPLPLVPVGAGSADSSTSVIINGNASNGAGSYPLTAVYSGDANYNGITFNNTHIIGATNGTTTTLALCIGPSPTCPSTGVVSPPYVPVLSMIYGQTFNGNATVTKNDTNPLTGTTTFTDNGTVLCTLNTAVGGSCPPNVGTGLNSGQHNIVATYSGDPNHTGSTSQTVTINVSPDTTTTSISGGPSPAVQGTPVTFTAIVTGQFAPPTGSVTFLNGSTPIGTATLVTTGSITSAATFTTTALPVGTDQISASYGATLDFLGSSSSAIPETITPQVAPSFTLTVTPQALDIGVGYTGAIAVTITSNNGFSAPVNLSCGPLPNEARCTFLAPIINGAGTTTLFLATTAPHDCSNSQPYFLGSNDGGFGLRSLALPAMAGLFMFCLPGRRRWMRGLLMLAIAAGAMQVSGCGHCTDLATRPGTYRFTVNAATGGSSGETQSQTVTINVHI